jgi:hypothetical protein
LSQTLQPFSDAITNQFLQKFSQISNGRKALEIKQKIIRNFQRFLFRINAKIPDPAVQDPQKVQPIKQGKIANRFLSNPQNKWHR